MKKFERMLAQLERASSQAYKANADGTDLIEVENQLPAIREALDYLEDFFKRERVYHAHAENIHRMEGPPR